MKRLFASTAAALVLISYATTSRAEYLFPPYDNTVAAWLFDEGSGLTFKDATTNNNTGSLVAFGNAWGFNTTTKQYGTSSISHSPSTGASTDQGLVLDSSSLHALTNNFTVEGWWRLQAGGNFPTLISREDAGRNATAWDMGLTGANVVEARVYDAGGCCIFVNDLYPFPTNQFTH